MTSESGEPRGDKDLECSPVSHVKRPRVDDDSLARVLELANRAGAQPHVRPLRAWRREAVILYMGTLDHRENSSWPEKWPIWGGRQIGRAHV